MSARRSLHRLTPLVVAAGLLALAMGPIPGKWVVQDGGKLVRKPPKNSNLDLAVFQNSGPDEVVLSSKGTAQNKTLTVEPDGVVVQFVIPVGGKNVVIRDAHLDGQGAKGTLIWAKFVKPKIDIRGGGGQ